MISYEEALERVADPEVRAAIEWKVARLEKDLEWERDASGVMLRAGHEPACCRVEFPRAFFPCNCAHIRVRRMLEGERLAALRCVQEAGSATGPRTGDAVLAPGVSYCMGALRPTVWNGKRELTCLACRTTYTSESFNARGVKIDDALAGIPI